MTTIGLGYKNKFESLYLNNTHTKSLKVYETIKFSVEWLLSNLTRSILAISKQMRRFSSREVTTSNFLDIQKIEKDESLIRYSNVQSSNFFFIVFKVYIDFKI